MNVHVADIDSALLPDLFDWCRRCVYWESPAQFQKLAAEDGARLKAEWFEATAAQFNPCGKLLYADDEPAAYCQYAPPRFVPGIAEYPGLAPQVDPDAVFITCLHVPKQYRRQGLGRLLLQDVIEELRSRGCGAVETVARDDSANNCSGPTEFYLKQGFRVITTETYPDGKSFSLVRVETEVAA